MARRARPTVGLFPGLALDLQAVARKRRHALRGVGPDNLLAVRWPPCRVAADLHRMHRGHYHRSRPPLLYPVTDFASDTPRPPGLQGKYFQDTKELQRTRYCVARGLNLNEKFVQFGNKRLKNAQNCLANGTGQKHALVFSNS
jgi:hypothetical protein